MTNVALGAEEAHPHPRGKRLEPEQLLGRVMTRDGGKTLAGDTPTAVDVRRLSTRQLRQRRDELAALRASCPPDRSQELQRARERAVDLEQARRAAQAEHQAAAAALATAGRRLLRRREQAVARDRVSLAEHALRTVSGQAEHASERVGLLRRRQQERAGWLEQHHDLPLQERATARELGWRQRVDERAMVLTQPGWLVEALGPMPPAERPAEQRAWLAAAVALDGYRRAYGLDHEWPAKHAGGERTQAGRDGLAGTADRVGRPTPERAAAGDQPQVRDETRRGRPGWRHPARERPGRRPERPTLGQERAGRVAELLGAEPGRRQGRAAAATGSSSRPPWSALHGCAPATPTATTIAPATATATASSAPMGGRSGSSTHGREPVMYQPHHRPDPDPDDQAGDHLDPWSADDLEDDPQELELGTPVYEGTGLSVRALTAEELDRFLEAHAGQPAQLLGSGWDALRPSARPTGAPPRGSPDPPDPATLGWPAPLPAGPRLAPRGGYGSPGRSALATYRQQRAAELAGWTRTAGWRAACVIAAGMLASVLLQAAGLDRLALPVGLAAATAAGWRLRFRVTRDTRAWRDGARGEWATARLLRRLGHRGWVVFHDLAIPGTPANADHLLIGPPGAILVDSKRYTGQVTQGLDGRVWHNHHPMDHTLRSLRLETHAISAALGVPVRPVMCVHQAQVAHGGITAGDVEILPAGRLRGMLRGSGQQLGEADVAALVAQALSVLRPTG